MDVTNIRYCDSIPQSAERGKIKFSREINELDLIPDSDSSNCRCCDVDEVPKVFPKHTRGQHASLNESSSTSSDTQQHTQCVPCPPTGFFQKVMENAKSILNIKCSNIHQTNSINEEPTKDTDSCECESDKPWQSTNSTSKGVAYVSLPMRSSSEECLCDEESTKNDISADSYSCSVSCSCKTSDEHSKEVCTCKTHTNNSTDSRNNAYKNQSSSKSDSTYQTESCSKSDPKSVSVKSHICTCTNSQINLATYSIKNRVNSCACGNSNEGISDKVVQSKIEQYDMSCECAVKMHSTGTKIYNVAGVHQETLQRPAQVDASVSQSKSKLKDQIVEARARSQKSFACVTVPCNEKQKCELKSCWINTKLGQLKSASVGITKPFCNDPVCPVSINLTKSPTAPNISYGVQVEKRKSFCNIGTCPSAKKMRSRSGFRDQNDQCAFVGSPILRASNFKTGKRSVNILMYYVSAKNNYLMQATRSCQTKL